MLTRLNTRYYLYGFIAALLLLVVFTLPSTSIPTQTGTYVKNLLGHKEESKEITYGDGKWFFETDLDTLDPIAFDFERLRNLPPHNYRGPGHETFATLYASRNASMQNPYFDATQQIVYRLLWQQRTKTVKHPVTVFVTPYVNQTQRDYFTAAGAIVRELSLHPFTPDMSGVSARLQDMFSKLEMWRQLDFSRIAYMDGDAIPLVNIDNIFSEVPEQTCRYDMVPEADKVFGKEICRYAFGAHPESHDGINAGVMIFKPEQAMYTRLIRESLNRTGWDTGYLEQALLSHLYHVDGPFPPSELDPGYNSFPDYKEKGIEIKILHDKMWAHYFDPLPWVTDEWSSTWAAMKQFYESEEYLDLRLADQRAMEAEVSRLPHS